MLSLYDHNVLPQEMNHVDSESDDKSSSVAHKSYASAQTKNPEPIVPLPLVSYIQMKLCNCFIFGY